MVLPLSDESKQKCFLCHKMFDDIDSLKNHQSSIHSEFFEFHEKNDKRTPAPGDVALF